jgi:hypothetical protein
LRLHSLQLALNAWVGGQLNARVGGQKLFVWSIEHLTLVKQRVLWVNYAAHGIGAHCPHVVSLRCR